MADAAQIAVPGLGVTTSGFSPTNFVVSATTSAVEWIFQAADAITITQLGFRYGARAGTPPSYIISLQGVDASGNPDGVVKGGGSPVRHVFTPPATTAWDGTWRWQALDNSYTCTRGEFLAIVVAYSSGTIDGSNNSSFTSCGNIRGSNAGFPYAIHNNAGSRARQTANPPALGYASASKAYGYPWQAAYNTAITASTTPDELAVAFQLNSGYGSTFQVKGIRAAIDWSVGASSFVVNLYSGTTVLQTVTVDSDYEVALGAASFVDVFFSDTTLATLTYGSLYRIGFQPVGTTGNWRFRGMTMAAAADMAAWQGGTQMYLSTRTDAGAWTDDPTTRPFVDLILNDSSAAAAAAGVPMSRIQTGM